MSRFATGLLWRAVPDAYRTHSGDVRPGESIAWRSAGLLAARAMEIALWPVARKSCGAHRPPP
ncbi:MAG TPA: hypothetical protein VFW98_05860, partial [Gemmatimonadaceae bacterium]|nr:hypothetical protein [Gemmatimonadaceae bacterium]